HVLPAHGGGAFDLQLLGEGQKIGRRLVLQLVELDRSGQALDLLFLRFFNDFLVVKVLVVEFVDLVVHGSPGSGSGLETARRAQVNGRKRSGRAGAETGLARRMEGTRGGTGRRVPFASPRFAV